MNAQTIATLVLLGIGSVAGAIILEHATGLLASFRKGDRRA